MPVGRFGAHFLEPFLAVADNAGYGGNCLNVIDHRGAGVEPFRRREGRLQTRLAAPSFERIEQGRFLSTDVGTGSGVNRDVQIVIAMGAKALANQTGFFGLTCRRHEAPIHVHNFATQVYESVMSSNRQEADRHSFDQRVRISHKSGHILARSRLGFVRVHYEVARATVRSWKEGPFQARGEASATAPR